MQGRDFYWITGLFTGRTTVRASSRGHLIGMGKSAIDAGTRMGHVHLKVADLERALKFYNGVLGFDVTQRFGDQAAFLSAGGYHHHIGLNTWESKGGEAPAAGTTGLFHLAIVYPTRAALGDALQRLMKAGISLDGAADHGVSQALYLRDRTEMGWSCTGTVRRRSGRRMHRTGWRCIRVGWICGRC
jgi:catechol 2,3-dioxygenase